MSRDYSIDFVKSFAILFILNAHLGSFYGRFAALATGSDLGNALFFFCSGFLLWDRVDGGFGHWFRHRIARLWPTMIAWSAISCILSRLYVSESEPFQTTFFALTGHGLWFVQVIMIYYVLFYLVARFCAKRLLAVICASIVVIALRYAYLRWIQGVVGNIDLYHGLRYWFWLPFMLLGAMVKERPAIGRYRGLKSWVFLIGSIVLFYVIHFPSIHSESWSALLMVNIFTALAFSVACLQVSRSAVVAGVCGIAPVVKVVVFFSSLSLEIYVTHFFLLKTGLSKIVFPFNILAFLCCAVVLAWITQYCARQFTQIIKAY